MKFYLSEKGEGRWDLLILAMACLLFLWFLYRIALLILGVCGTVRPFRC